MLAAIPECSRRRTDVGRKRFRSDIKIPNVSRCDEPICRWAGIMRAHHPVEEHAEPPGQQRGDAPDTDTCGLIEPAEQADDPCDPCWSVGRLRRGRILPTQRFYGASCREVRIRLDRLDRMAALSVSGRDP